MSQDAQRDYDEFRRMAAAYSENFVRKFPEAAKSDWVVACYQSLDAYNERFPYAEDRDYALKQLEKCDKAGRAMAKAFCDGVRTATARAHQKRNIGSKAKSSMMPPTIYPAVREPAANN